MDDEALFRWLRALLLLELEYYKREAPLRPPRQGMGPRAPEAGEVYDLQDWER